MLPKGFIFDPARLQELSKEAIASHPDGNSTHIMQTLAVKLREEYGEKYINEYEKDKWMFNNAVWA